MTDPPIHLTDSVRLAQPDNQVRCAYTDTSIAPSDVAFIIGDPTGYVVDLSAVNSLRQELTDLTRDEYRQLGPGHVFDAVPGGAVDEEIDGVCQICHGGFDRSDAWIGYTETANPTMKYVGQLHHDCLPTVVDALDTTITDHADVVLAAAV